MKDEGNRGDCSDDRARSYPSGGPGSIGAPAPAWSPPWLRLPLELRERPQWLLAVPDADGDLKVPRSVNGYGTLLEGSSTDRSTWLSFETACSWATVRKCGIGYVLAADDPFSCIDFDVKPDTTQEQLDLYWRIALGLDSYTERSQSGQGLHIWCVGKIGHGLKRDGVELYSQERFIACTGDTVLDRPIRERQEMLTNMATQMKAAATRKGKRILATLLELPPRKSDEQVLKGIDRWSPERRDKFRRLWQGLNADGTSFWNAKGAWVPKDYQSQSEADCALLNELCLTIESNEQVRRLFRMSMLGQRLNGKLPGKRKADPQRYLNETLAFIRPFPGTTIAYTVRPKTPDGDALPTPLIRIQIDEKVGAWFDRVAATMPKFG